MAKSGLSHPNLPRPTAAPAPGEDVLGMRRCHDCVESRVLDTGRRFRRFRHIPGERHASGRGRPPYRSRSVLVQGRRSGLRIGAVLNGSWHTLGINMHWSLSIKRLPSERILVQRRPRRCGGSWVTSAAHGEWVPPIRLRVRRWLPASLPGCGTCCAHQ
jgi:hypothetical protein